MVRVFNIGFNKSGTTSLNHAMEILGFNALHFKNYDGVRIRSIIENNKTHNKMLMSGLEEYNFICDFNGERFFRLLDEQYPNSKFILTWRDMEEWLVSREKHVIKNQRNPNYIGNWLTVDIDSWRANRERCEKEIFEYFNGRDDFLVMKICDGDGWNELCGFLGVDIPDIPFPHLNRVDYHK